MRGAMTLCQLKILTRNRGEDQTLFYVVTGSNQYGVVMMNSCSMVEVEIELKRVIMEKMR